MRLNWRAAGIVLLLHGCDTGEPARVVTPADPSEGTVAIEWAGPNQAAMVVPVYVNGAGPYSFVLDTGATLTCVDVELAEELSLPDVRGRIGVGAGVGSAGQMRIVSIDSLRVGEARTEETIGCALDLSSAEQIGIEFDGLLGLNFLREFRVELDFDRDEVRLR